MCFTDALKCHMEGHDPDLNMAVTWGSFLLQESGHKSRAEFCTLQFPSRAIMFQQGATNAESGPWGSGAPLALWLCRSVTPLVLVSDCPGWRRVKRAQLGPHDWLSVPVPVAQTWLLVQGLEPETAYQFSVLAQNKLGTGPFSEVVTVNTLGRWGGLRGEGTGSVQRVESHPTLISKKLLNKNILMS